MGTHELADKYAISHDEQDQFADRRFGLAAMCIGVGQGIAVVFENVGGTR